jgi:hypothetical protein
LKLKCEQLLSSVAFKINLRHYTKVLTAGFDKEYGARPLRRAIMSIVDDNLSEAMLMGHISAGHTAVLDFDEATAELGLVRAGGGAASGNTYCGVSVAAVLGDPAAAGYDVAWCSLDQDVEEGVEEGGVASVRLNNISSRPVVNGVNVDVTV